METQTTQTTQNYKTYVIWRHGDREIRTFGGILGEYGA